MDEDNEELIELVAKAIISGTDHWSVCVGEARKAIIAVLKWQRKQVAPEPRPPIYPAEWLAPDAE